jgi:hypothetical protein
LSDFLSRAIVTIQYAPELEWPIPANGPVPIDMRTAPLLAEISTQQAAYRAILVRLVRVRAVRAYGLHALPAALAF